MGIHLNPSSSNFISDKDSHIYVDKSLMLAELNGMLNSNKRFVCVSRPRRFGKTMAGNMIAAYYCKDYDSHALFDDLRIAQHPSFEKHLNKYNVIKIDLNGFYRKTGAGELIPGIVSRLKKEFASQFPTLDFSSDYLDEYIQEAFAATGQQFVIVIDEYDVLVRENVKDVELTRFLNFLVSLFKNDAIRPAIALAYITGILPIVRDAVQSKLNNFDEYTMAGAGALAEHIGFTADEVRSLCNAHHVPFEEMQRWYDGYDLSFTPTVGRERGKRLYENASELFNPKSVVSAIENHNFTSYWTQTGSYEVLKTYIQLNCDGVKDGIMKMLGGVEVPVDVRRYLNKIDAFNTKDEIFTYLIHLGYLAYNQDCKTCRIPNNEIRDQWIDAIITDANYSNVIRIVDASRQLLEDTLSGNEEAVARGLNEAHFDATNPLIYNNEGSLQSAIGLAYFYATAKYTIVKELPTGKGFADMVFIPYVPDTPAMIVELKNNRSTYDAMILDRRYDHLLRHYTGSLLLVAVNYDEKTKQHQCQITKMEC